MIVAAKICKDKHIIFILQGLNLAFHGKRHMTFLTNIRYIYIYRALYNPINLTRLFCSLSLCEQHTTKVWLPNPRSHREPEKLRRTHCFFPFSSSPIPWSVNKKLQFSSVYFLPQKICKELVRFEKGSIGHRLYTIVTLVMSSQPLVGDHSHHL